MTGCCEHDNGSSGSMKDGEILDNVSYCHLLKRICKGEVFLTNLVLIGEVRPTMAYCGRIAACGWLHDLVLTAFLATCSSQECATSLFELASAGSSYLTPDHTLVLTISKISRWFSSPTVFNLLSETRLGL